MTSSEIVQFDELRYGGPELVTVVISPEAKPFIFDGTPEALDIIYCRLLDLCHPYWYISVFFKWPVKSIEVNWLPWSVLNIFGFLPLVRALPKAFSWAWVSNGVRQFPSNDIATIPIDYCSQIHKAFTYANISDIDTPDFVNILNNGILSVDKGRSDYLCEAKTCVVWESVI